MTSLLISLIIGISIFALILWIANRNKAIVEEESHLDTKRYSVLVPKLKLTISSDKDIVFPIRIQSWNIQTSSDTVFVVAQAKQRTENQTEPQRIEMQFDYLRTSDMKLEFDIYDMLTENNLITKNGFIYDDI